MDDQERFEAYLRQFRPRRPGPLPGHVSSRPTSVRWWLTAAAAVLAVCGLALRTRWPVPAPQPHAIRIEATVVHDTDDKQTATLWRLSGLMQGDPDQLDTALTAASAELLPRIDRPERALYGLAKP